MSSNLPRLTSQTTKDAGLLREYIGIRFGQIYEFGGSTDQFKRAMSYAKQLARMTGQTVEAVTAQAIQDRANWEKGEGAAEAGSPFSITIYEKPGIGTPEYYDTLIEILDRVTWCLKVGHPFTVGNPHREGLRG